MEAAEYRLKDIKVIGPKDKEYLTGARLLWGVI
jgi:hypothetical protein